MLWSGVRCHYTELLPRPSALRGIRNLLQIGSVAKFMCIVRGGLMGPSRIKVTARPSNAPHADTVWDQAKQATHDMKNPDRDCWGCNVHGVQGTLGSSSGG